MRLTKWITLIYLVTASLYDWRKRLVYLPAAAFFFSVGIIFMMKEDLTMITLILRFLPGLMVLCLSAATRGGIGIGDGIVLLIMGEYMPFDQVVLSFLWGILLSFGAAAVIFLRKRKRRLTIPFVPCLMGGYLLNLLMEM